MNTRKWGSLVAILEAAYHKEKNIKLNPIWQTWVIVSQVIIKNRCPCLPSMRQFLSAWQEEGLLTSQRWARGTSDPPQHCRTPLLSAVTSFLHLVTSCAAAQQLTLAAGGLVLCNLLVQLSLAVLSADLVSLPFSRTGCSPRLTLQLSRLPCGTLQGPSGSLSTQYHESLLPFSGHMEVFLYS